MEKKPETEYAKELYMRGYFPCPEICNCGSKSFEIQIIQQIKHMDVFSGVEITNAEKHIQ